MKDLTHFQWSEELLKFLQESKKQKFRFDELPDNLRILSHLHWAKNRGYIIGTTIYINGKIIKLWQPSSSILQRIKI
ncbi:MAG: hypothetical protein SVV88_08730 [Pseudomonadota bacterium]|jgi:hypothetical protein|nr:hypothetical protein [Pseudomonadota bacterium]